MKSILVFCLMVISINCFAAPTNLMINVIYHHHVTMGKKAPIKMGVGSNVQFEMKTGGWAKTRWNLSYAMPSLATLYERNDTKRYWFFNTNLVDQAVIALTNEVGFVGIAVPAGFREAKFKADVDLARGKSGVTNKVTYLERLKSYLRP